MLRCEFGKAGDGASRSGSSASMAARKVSMVAVSMTSWLVAPNAHNGRRRRPLCRRRR